MGIDLVRRPQRHHPVSAAAARDRMVIPSHTELQLLVRPLISRLIISRVRGSSRMHHPAHRRIPSAPGFRP